MMAAKEQAISTRQVQRLGLSMGNQRKLWSTQASNSNLLGDINRDVEDKHFLPERSISGCNRRSRELTLCRIRGKILANHTSSRPLPAANTESSNLGGERPSAVLYPNSGS